MYGSRDPLKLEPGFDATQRRPGRLRWLPGSDRDHRRDNLLPKHGTGKTRRERSDTRSHEKRPPCPQRKAYGQGGRGRGNFVSPSSCRDAAGAMMAPSSRQLKVECEPRPGPRDHDLGCMSLCLFPTTPNYHLRDSGHFRDQFLWTLHHDTPPSQGKWKQRKDGYFDGAPANSRSLPFHPPAQPFLRSSRCASQRIERSWGTPRRSRSRPAMKSTRSSIVFGRR